MLGWIIAAAGLWRGLTTEEVDDVHAEVQAQLTAQSLDLTLMTASDAQAMLTDAIGVVLERTRR
ncbi:hypothetical protein [Microbacterium sp. 13-71-7]|jgi:hypothetical protein|uniref:hypothetical protein n=1 Tax=Microbacterium sp. 13-71-7 TaxID=1970399 RepID=UPI000BD79AF6|nr:hypothetical protein [Microbacterium sp. 13-71-7]OZB84332.1 MAG: hypothetical protein B7X32_07570 [Microbacterium sp. 13-71-7]